MQQYFLFELKDGESIFIGGYETLLAAKEYIRYSDKPFSEYEIAEVNLEKWILSEDLRKETMIETLLYNNVILGDWVQCGCCGKQMLLPLGSDKCPECGASGDLMWVSENENEHEIEKYHLFDISAEYHATGRELSESDCFCND